MHFPLLSYKLSPATRKKCCLTGLISILITLISACEAPTVQEITAANNGVKFRILSGDPNPKDWEYHGSYDSQRRAHGKGSYALRDTFYGGYHYQGSGKFKNGQPDGVHNYFTKAPVVEGLHIYRNGEFISEQKTRNDVPAFMLGAFTGGLTTLVTGSPPITNTDQSITKGHTGIYYTDVVENYPEGYAYNVTTYIGQYATDRYSFATMYGLTTRATAERNLEAGRRVYGGDDSIRPGWFYIEAVPVRKGSKIKVGLVGIR